ncbi:Na+/H+ antiporter NhaC family protein [Paenibacillus sp. MBLB4367]|uniref:Na+/H+ antiporter NhaC family protein n=1 Tax=Paenibacillus sp. MBLB4367 TaxID=3384767 RepID=UPI003907F727
MILGTSTGTLSAVGIPLMGTAALLGIPLPAAAGALVSGAFIGDRTSPFSSAHQLVASSAGIGTASLWKALRLTTAAAILCTLLFYACLDAFAGWTGKGGGAPETVSFAGYFRYHPLLLVPPLVLVAAILFRMRTKYAFMLSIGASIGIGTWLQAISLPQWLDMLWSGYGAAELPSLQTNGLWQMAGLVVLIALAGAYNGILEENRLLQPYIERWIGRSETMASLTLRSGLFGLGLGLVSCTQTLPIMMSGSALQPIWSKSFGKQQLARVVADTSLVFAAMVPWNMLAILCGTIVGVPVEGYVPFAVFLWILPLLTLAVSAVKGRTESKALRKA